MVPDPDNVGKFTEFKFMNIRLCPECQEGEITPRGHCDECLECGWRACSYSPKV